jgi:hypothetical protein
MKWGTVRFRRGNVSFLRLGPPFLTPFLFSCVALSRRKGFGLPHSDESFTNADLGNCMDYTNSPLYVRE